MIRVVFMGTPAFAGRILEQLYAEDTIQLVGVVSQPDEPVGRKHILTSTVTKQLAITHGTPVFQPVRLRNDYKTILEWHPDLLLTCAYGQIVPDEVLQAPRLGAFNLHASLLPKYRGGAPIQRAIMAGEKKTGMTLMRMSAKMDAGNILAQKETEIPEEYTYGMLEKDLMESAAALLHEWLPRLAAGGYEETVQDEAEVTFAWNIKPEEERISFNGKYEDVYNHIRGLIPRPVTYGILPDGKKIKFWGIEPSTEKTDAPDGTILPFDKTSMRIACDKRVLHITEVQEEGKKISRAPDYKNGRGRLFVGKLMQE